MLGPGSKSDGLMWKLAHSLMEMHPMDRLWEPIASQMLIVTFSDSELQV
jgi:hypothetical protein